MGAEKNGTTIVAAFPLPEAGLIRYGNPHRASAPAGRDTTPADSFLQIRSGADPALIRR